MKVVHIQYGMPPAGNACFRLHQAMCNVGIESSIITFSPTVKRNNVVNINGGWGAYIRKCINGIKYRYVRSLLHEGAYSYSFLPRFANVIHNHPLVKNADVIYLHWIAGGSLSMSEIDKIASLGKPVIMFMHDMWDFTGGCHHSFECEQYKTGCKDCKMFKASSNLPYRQAKEKYEVFSKHQNIVFVSPSKWMEECARQSYALQKNKVMCINNLIDDKVFKKIDKVISRQILNVPLDKTIITFGCQAGINNKYKGWDYLQQALQAVSDDNIHILIFGSDSNNATIEQVPFPITFLGPIYDETKLALICNASDLFVSPSLAESFGMTFLENVLCGTPVVGFDNTAIGEIVISSTTGYLAKNKNADDLAYGINFLINNKSLKPAINYQTSNVLNSHIELISSVL